MLCWTSSTIRAEGLRRKELGRVGGGCKTQMLMIVMCMPREEGKLGGEGAANGTWRESGRQIKSARRSMVIKRRDTPIGHPHQVYSVHSRWWFALGQRHLYALFPHHQCDDASPCRLLRWKQWQLLQCQLRWHVSSSPTRPSSASTLITTSSQWWQWRALMPINRWWMLVRLNCKIDGERWVKCSIANLGPSAYPTDGQAALRSGCWSLFYSSTP